MDTKNGDDMEPSDSPQPSDKIRKNPDMCRCSGGTDNGPLTNTLSTK